MKKIHVLLLIIFSIFLITGCDKKTSNLEPDLSQIRNISDLATVKAYYHNVAKVEKEKGSGITHIGEKNRKYWIEYTGVVKIGVKMSEITTEVKGNKVIVKMPKAVVLSHNYEDYNDKSIYKNDDSNFNSNKITNEEVNEAITKADNQMLVNVKANKGLFNQAEDNAKKLIKNYIEKIGELSNTNYEVQFEIIESLEK